MPTTIIKDTTKMMMKKKNNDLKKKKKKKKSSNKQSSKSRERKNECKEEEEEEYEKEKEKVVVAPKNDDNNDDEHHNEEEHDAEQQEEQQKVEITKVDNNNDDDDDNNADTTTTKTNIESVQLLLDGANNRLAQVLDQDGEEAKNLRAEIASHEEEINSRKSSLLVQCSSEEEHNGSVLSTRTFSELGVCELICNATSKLGWNYATQIQCRVLPEAFVGSDIIGLAETGSGKTGAFVIPILQELLMGSSYKRGSVFALILTPTRELAFQIHDVVEALSSNLDNCGNIKSICIVGGVDITSQSIAISKNPHILVATPGRLVDHLTNTKGFHLRQIQYLILDEADRMLSLDFEEEINTILEEIPTSTTRKTMLFSATMTNKVEKLQRASLSNPIKIEISKSKFQTPIKLLQYYLFIPAKYKDVYLTYLINEHVGQSILVFGATCNNVQRLTLMLRNLNFPALCLHGQMSQPKRLGALNKFKSSDRDILICTDVASRGLDIPNVDLVINYDLPLNGKDYIHRVGRTARAGKSGKAISIVTQYDVEIYQRIEGLLGKKLPEYSNLQESTVLILLERVSEAQRLATRELKEQLAAAARGGSNGRRKRRSIAAGEEEDGFEDEVKKELKKGYFAGGSGGRGGALHNQRGSSKNNKNQNKKYRR